MCQSKEHTAYETEFNKLVSEGAEYLIGSCNALFELRGVFQEQLTQLCADHLCDGPADQPKFDNRMEALYERFEQAVVDETIHLEYFQCETCGWWCWCEERSNNSAEQTCTDCEDEEGDD